MCAGQIAARTPLKWSNGPPSEFLALRTMMLSLLLCRPLPQLLFLVVFLLLLVFLLLVVLLPLLLLLQVLLQLPRFITLLLAACRIGGATSSGSTLLMCFSSQRCPSACLFTISDAVRLHICPNTAACSAAFCLSVCLPVPMWSSCVLLQVLQLAALAQCLTYVCMSTVSHLGKLRRAPATPTAGLQRFQSGLRA